MDERELELNAIRERNEKNKAFHDKLTRFYIGLIIPILLIGLIACVAGKNTMAIWVMAAIFVVWVVWLICGIVSIKCPHCKANLNRSDPFNIRLCPYCGTILKVYPDADNSGDKH